MLSRKKPDLLTQQARLRRKHRLSGWAAVTAQIRSMGISPNASSSTGLKGLVT